MLSARAPRSVSVGPATSVAARSRSTWRSMSRMRASASVSPRNPDSNEVTTRRRSASSFAIPALFLLGQNDQTAPPAPCIVMAEDLRESGRVAEAHVYEGVGHGFDHANPPGDPDAGHSPKATAQAHRALLDFLERHAENSGI